LRLLETGSTVTGCASAKRRLAVAALRAPTCAVWGVG